MAFKILNTVIKISIYIVIIGLFILGVQVLLSGIYPHLYETSTNEVMLTFVDMEYNSINEGDAILYYNPKLNSSNMNAIQSINNQRITLENGTTIKQARVSGKIIMYTEITKIFK